MKPMWMIFKPWKKKKKYPNLPLSLVCQDEQQNKLKASIDKYKPQIDQKETEFKIAQDNFSSGIKNPNATSSDLQTLFQKRVELGNALQTIHFQSRMAFREILTPTQRSKMISLQESRQHKKPAEKNSKKSDMPADVPAPQPVQ